ncbi:MAG: TIGR02710 family CRISPR-associated CARF protein [Candidatus Methanomethylicaceae archaeon]
MKALIISVGTGSAGTTENTINLARAIAFSIKHYSPDRVYFVLTKESLEKTLPEVLKGTGVIDHELINLDDPDNVAKIYEYLQPYFDKIRKSSDYLIVDYTSGTKAMSAALAILGALYEANELGYIAGKRKGGIVQAGTEHIISVRPYFVKARQREKMALGFFDHAQYDICVRIFKEILEMTKDPDIVSRVEPYMKLAEAYSLWDKFQHQQAFEIIKSLKFPALDRNKCFLGRLISRMNHEPEPYFVADLINNATRRGDEEQKYDDAVARLYRTTELLAQYRVRKICGVEPSEADPSKIPAELIEKWREDTSKPLKLGLHKCYELLFYKGDVLGKEYKNDERLRDLLSKRNRSILAHGFEPVDKETYIELRDKVLKMATITIADLESLLKDSRFVKSYELS